MAEIHGKVETVTGPVDVSELGVVLPHEHFSYGHCPLALDPPAGYETMAYSPLTLNHIGWIRQHPYSHKLNVCFRGEEVHNAIIKDVLRYKNHGGGTIVENTTVGLERNTIFLRQLAKATGVYVIAGTGYYEAKAQKQTTLQLSVEEMTNHMVAELTEGCCDDKAVKCGVIGEVGTGWPLHEFEKRSLEAVAEAQKVTNAPVIIHPGRNKAAPEEIMRVFTEAGGDPTTTIMSHLERTLFHLDNYLELGEWGCYMEFDLFGMEVSHYQLDRNAYMPSDEQRIRMIRHLLDKGLEDRLTISHDIHTRIRLTEFGGHGYSHIQENVIPKMRDRHISETVIDKITRKNPQRWLAANK